MPYNKQNYAVSEFTNMTDTTKLTIRLPSEDVAFVKAYARANGLSVTQVIDRYLRRMRTLDDKAPAPELDAIIGLVPADVDARTELHQHRLRKHGQ
jgi:hypothetical protein